MKSITLEVLAKISIVIFSFLILYYAVAGVTSKPWEYDSLAYHIPISNLITSARFLNPGNKTNPIYSIYEDTRMVYSPGASEIILSIFDLLRIPLNLFNVLGILTLFFVMRALAKSYEFSDTFSTIFASTFATLHTIMRWALTQTIDIWLLVFFGLSILLLMKPKGSYYYFLSLGAALGMVLGSKYTGPAYLVFLLIIFGREVLRKLNLKRFLVFFVPFSILGLFWYVRNYVLTGDPYFPQSIPFFKGVEFHILDYPVWKTLFVWKAGPITWINSYFSEYSVWFLTIIIVPILYILTLRILKHDFKKQILQLLLLGLSSYIIYFFLPSGPFPQTVTSCLRYSFPAFLCFILCIFIYAKKFMKEEFLSIIAITCMFIMPEISYHPKILLALIPISLIIFYPLEVKKLGKLVKKNCSHKRM